jgi:tetratricopeptide (TPR) repeat protein
MEANDTRAAIEFYRAALESSPLHRPLRDKLGLALLAHAEHRVSRSSTTPSSRFIAPAPLNDDEPEDTEEVPLVVDQPRRYKTLPAAKPAMGKRLFPPPEPPKPQPQPSKNRVSRGLRAFEDPLPPAPAPSYTPRRGPVVASRTEGRGGTRRWHSAGFAVLYAGILLIVAGVAHGVLVRVLTPIELPALPSAPMLPVEVLEQLEDAGKLLSAREPEKAVALLERTQSAFPDHAATITPALARALRVLGNRHLSVRDYQQAEMAFERAATLESDNPDNWIDLAKARREFGRSLQPTQGERGNTMLRASVDAYLRALKIQPDMASAHVGLGQTYSFLNDRTKAVDHFRRVVALAPGSPEARLAEEHLSQLVGRS